MKLCHKLTFGTFNSACYFLREKLPITNVTWENYRYTMWIKEHLVAEYSERTQTLFVYCDLNWYVRLYGKLR